MKIFKNALLFILKTAAVMGLIFLSLLGWGLLIFAQTPGGLFDSKPIPLYWVLIDLLIILPLNIAVIVIAAVFLSRLGVESGPEKPKLWKRIVHPAAIIAAAGAVTAIIASKDIIDEKFTDISVNQYVARSDEIVTYENSGDLYGDGMFDTDIRRASMLFDYDKMTVTFLYRMSWEHVKQVQLKENGFVPSDDHILQFKNPLRDGGEVRVYYDKNGDGTSLRPSFKTCAVTVEHLGKTYGAYFEPQPMDFESCLEDIYALENRHLKTVPYRDNEMLPYAGSLKSDTIFLDPENNKLYLVYVDTSGFGVPNVRLGEYELVETNRIENVFIQAEFDLENGDKLCAFVNEDQTKYANDPVMNWRTEITNGLALKYSGKLYMTEFNTNRHYHDFASSTGAVSHLGDRTTIE